MTPPPDEPTGIDPVRYGVLWERVESLDRRAEKMEQQLEALLELANKSKGGLWFGMTVVSMLSAVVGFVASHWNGAP